MVNTEVTLSEIQQAVNFLGTVFSDAVTQLNFSVTIGSVTFGMLDFFVVTFLMGLVVRNFIYQAK